MHGARLAVVPEIEGTILANDSGDWKESGEKIAPSSRAARDDDHMFAGGLESFKGGVACSREPAVECDGVIEIGEDEFDIGEFVRRGGVQRLHGNPKVEPNRIGA
jgi:hypothetical protein